MQNEQVTQINTVEGAKNIVIFVHGFGVRWDSRGMFIEIKESLPASWGSVLFDFYKIQGNDVYIEPVQNQVDRLTSIISNVKQINKSATIHMVAHSKGCTVASLARINVSGKVIFLSPPENFGTKLEDYFRRYPGATSSENEVVIPRRDGTITHIPVEFFEETAKIQAELEMNEYADGQEVNILQTTEDEVIGQTSYKLLQTNPNIIITKIAADHNFTGVNRDKLINYVQNILNTKSV